MDPSPTPLVTVVISTRNRGKSIVKTIRSILVNDYSRFEVNIVDQSDDDLTETALQPFLSTPCIRYLRTGTRGLSTGLNVGIGAGEGRIIAITDDDCAVAKDWLGEMVAAFMIDDRIGMVFGNTLPAPHDSALGFVPAYLRDGPFLARSIHHKSRVHGIGACMGLRRDVWWKLGRFDPMLGAGAPLRSASDMDFAIRVLLANYFIYETPRVTVIHEGFRTWEQGRDLLRRYMYGIGAMLVKHLKCGHWTVLEVLFHFAWRWAFRGPVVNLGIRRHSRLLRLVAFTKGFLAGASTPIDKTTGRCLYQSANHGTTDPVSDSVRNR